MIFHVNSDATQPTTYVSSNLHQLSQPHESSQQSQWFNHVVSRNTTVRSTLNNYPQSLAGYNDTMANNKNEQVYSHENYAHTNMHNDQSHINMNFPDKYGMPKNP